MPRPHKCRRINCQPQALVFKPAGVPVRELETISLRFDELEALRLADLEGFYQDEAARRMDVSRPTFGRLVAGARRKVARALLNGAVLTIEGGQYTMAQMRKFVCNACEHAFDVPFGTGRPTECPACHASEVCRAPEDRGGHGRGRCRRNGAGAGGRRQRTRGKAKAPAADTTMKETDTQASENQE